MRLVLISVFVLLLSLWIAGFAYFVYSSKSYRNDYVTGTDAIVVFTGGRQRIKVGADLLKAGYAPLLFISGVESRNQVQAFLFENGVPLEQVLYGHEASNTQGNALEIKQLVADYNIKSIRLVTSGYHMPRALLETRKMIGKNIAIIPHVVNNESTNYLVFFKEYNKYLAVLAMS